MTDYVHYSTREDAEAAIAALRPYIVSALGGPYPLGITCEHHAREVAGALNVLYPSSDGEFYACAKEDVPGGWAVERYDPLPDWQERLDEERATVA